MKRVTKFAVTAGTAISLALAAAAVSAQSFGYGMGRGGGHMGGYGTGPGYGMMGGGMMGGYGPGYGMGPQAMLNGYAGNTDEGFAALKSDLGITETQGPAWQAFVDNARQRNESRQAWFAKMQEAHSAGSAPELLAQQTELMQQRQAEMQANAAALKNLYATLTPQQKSIADQRFGGFGPGWNQSYRGGPRGYGR